MAQFLQQKSGMEYKREGKPQWQPNIAHGPYSNLDPKIQFWNDIFFKKIRENWAWLDIDIKELF